MELEEWEGCEMLQVLESYHISLCKDMNLQFREVHLLRLCF